MRELRPVLVMKGTKRTWVPSEPFSFLRRLIKLKFVVNHRGKLGEPKVYQVKSIMFDEKYGANGGTANEVTFMKKSPDGTEVKTTVAQHYKERWSIRLRYEGLPLIETTRGGMFPMELCNSIEHQRYNYKLNPSQVRLPTSISNMLK